MNNKENAQVKTRKGKKITTKDLVYIALFVALNAVCAWITIPSAIPFTLQVFGIFVTLGLLGGKRGTIAVLCYILLGTLGAPVFSGFRGGIAVLSGVTGGYIVGFILSALTYWGLTTLCKQKFFAKILGMGVGLLLCYAFGTAWFVFIKGKTGSPTDVGGALLLCVVPFIVFDVVKILLALFLTRVLSPKLHLEENKVKPIENNFQTK